MRHKKQGNKLGRTTAHRKATVGALVSSLIVDKRIRTTVNKAKAAQRTAERMVTLGRQGTLSARRRAMATLGRPGAVRELFDTVAGQFEERQGGYTRILKMGQRRSDGSEMAILEWVGTAPPAPPKKKSSDKKDANG